MFIKLLCHCWIQSIYFSHREVFRWVNTFNIDLIGIIRYTIHDGIGKSTFTITDLRYPQFTEKGAVILGVSKDSVSSHKRFEEKYGLTFTLLADPERKVIEAYDVWKEKKNYGKVSMGVVRTTYLIDEQGIIIKANDKVKAADDPENMLKELD